VAVSDEEQRRLRSVALQNASSIHQARLRADEALVRAKDELETKTQELSISLSLMRATLEATYDAILVTDSDGNVSHFNEQYLRLWGLPRESISSRSHRDIVQSTSRLFADPAAFLSRIEEIYNSQQEVSDELHLLDGRTVERFSKLQILDGRPVGRVWSFRDVTEGKRAVELQLRMAAVVESSDDAIVSKTLDGIITTWNAGAERMFGYLADEVLGRHITILFPPDRVQEEAIILERLRRGERIEHYETRRLRKDGTPIDVSITISPIKDRNGRIVGASKIARDITGRMKFEHEREELLASERVARTEAERASRLKDEFLATLSHELRTPLSAIVGWSQVLATGKASPADIEQGLDAIQRNARAQTQLIEDLLDMSRIISGKLTLNVQWTDLASVVNAAVDSVRPAADAKGIRLRKILDPHAGPVSGDPTRLQQVVWNLLSNALKFTPKGGAVDVLLQRVDSHLEITVRDTGIGISPEFLPVVFERFRQADASTTRLHGGLGLGLSIVRNLVELHGGTIRAESAGLNQGATFVVILPLAPIRTGESGEHPTSSRATALDVSQVDLSGVKVLVVDDEPDARALIGRVLTNCKAEVAVAASATEGLNQLASFRPHVLVSDIGMPGVDGYQFMREVRKRPPDQGGIMPAVALTAFARSEDRTKAMIAGYTVHVAKPIEPQELLATVANLAGRMGTQNL
jgi:PAS domain S-box-containing protein